MYRLAKWWDGRTSAANEGISQEKNLAADRRVQPWEESNQGLTAEWLLATGGKELPLG